MQDKGGEREESGAIAGDLGHSVKSISSLLCPREEEQSHWQDRFTSQTQARRGPFCKTGWCCQIQVSLGFQLPKWQKASQMAHNPLSLKHLHQREACGYQVHFIRNCQPHALFWKDVVQCDVYSHSLWPFHKALDGKSAPDLYVCSFPMVRTQSPWYPDSFKLNPKHESHAVKSTDR